MKKNKINKDIIIKTSIILISILTIIMLEQIIKYNMIGKEFFIFKYVENYGIAFSLLENNYILVISTIIMIFIFSFILIKKHNNKIYVISIIMIISGSISNLIDRIIRGYVIDYIKIDIIDFPVFNIADILIVIGIFILFVISIIEIIKIDNQPKG